MNRLQLDKVYAALRKSTSMEDRRINLLAMDSLLGESYSENSPELGEFYNFCVRNAVAEITRHDKTVPRLWKFYSSGMIIVSGGKVRAFDLNCGCEENFRRTRLRLKTDVIEALAEIIDEIYYTHNHIDHFGLELADALLKRNKMMVATTDTIQDWLLDGAIDSKELKSREVKVFHSFQRSAEKNLPNSVYILKLADNSHILIRGDMYHGEDVLELCEFLKTNDLHISYGAISPFGLTLPECSAELRKRYKSIMIPVHEWEFTHRTRGFSGKATQTFSEWYSAFPEDVAAERVRFLFWGESTLLN